MRLFLAGLTATPSVAFLALLVTAALGERLPTGVALGLAVIVLSGIPMALATMRHIGNNPRLSDRDRERWRTAIRLTAANSMPMYYLLHGHKRP